MSNPKRFVRAPSHEKRDLIRRFRQHLNIVYRIRVVQKRPLHSNLLQVFHIPHIERPIRVKRRKKLLILVKRNSHTIRKLVRLARFQIGVVILP